MGTLNFQAYRPITNRQTKRLKGILYWATEVKHLGMIPGMKFLLDENCQNNFMGSKNIINNKEFFANMGLETHGHEDDFILGMATISGYTVVTRDKKFVIDAYDQEIPIIYSPDDRRYFLVEKPHNTIRKDLKV
jgi:hypothetical protein